MTDSSGASGRPCVEPRDWPRLFLYTDLGCLTIDAAGTTVEIDQKALEVLRRQPDGTWRLVVGDPNGRAR